MQMQVCQWSDNKNNTQTPITSMAAVQFAEKSKQEEEEEEEDKGEEN